MRKPMAYFDYLLSHKASQYIISLEKGVQKWVQQVLSKGFEVVNKGKSII